MSARYVPLVKIASGGMATVYVGTLRGDLGFRRLVAIKRPHPHLAEDPEFRAALLEEAHVAARVQHANVVGVQDVEVAGDDVQLVMDYVEGATLAQLLSAASKRGEKLPARVALRIGIDACAGLAAVHEARDEHGAPLGLVHRDVSPQNLLIGLDGLARLSDFGTAKSALAGRPSTTQGTLKGKLAYMAPEYVGRGRLDLRVDVFAMGVVLWEALAGKRLFRGANDADTLDRVQREEAPPLREVAPELDARLDEAVARALRKRPEDRWPSADAFGAALAEIAQDGKLLASHAEVARAVREAVEPDLETRRTAVRARLAELDAGASSGVTPLLGVTLPIGAPSDGASLDGNDRSKNTPNDSSGDGHATRAGGVDAERSAPSASDAAGQSGRRRVRAGAVLGGVVAVLAAIGILAVFTPSKDGSSGAEALPAGQQGASAAPGTVASTASGDTSPALATASITASATPAAEPSAPADADASATASASATAPISPTTLPATAPPTTAATTTAATGTSATKPAAGSTTATKPAGGKRKAPPNPYAPR